jgi:predicted RNA binding protein YcfA (HicA-like mRNA interferase family)
MNHRKERAAHGRSTTNQARPQRSGLRFDSGAAGELAVGFACVKPSNDASKCQGNLIRPSIYWRSMHFGVMMAKLPRLKASKLMLALRKAGFRVERIRGSHQFLLHADGRATGVPVHCGEWIGPGRLVKFLRDCELRRAPLRDSL